MFTSISFAQYLFIKRVLLITTFICMILPVFWISFFEYSQKKIVRNFVKTLTTQPVNLAFENLTIQMRQDNQKIISLHSPNAQIYDLKISRIDMQSPQITLLEEKQPPKFLSADKGFYEQKTQNITVLENVQLHQKNTFDMSSDKMLVDLNNFTFKLPTGVKATYKNNSLKANNVEFQQKSNKAIFKGGVKLVIQPVGI